MLLWGIRLTQGYVRFAVLGQKAARVLNLATRNGLSVFDLKEKEGVLYASCPVKDYRNLTRLLRAQNQRRPGKAAPPDRQKQKKEPPQPTGEWWEQVLRQNEEKEPVHKPKKHGRLYRELAAILAPDPPRQTVAQPVQTGFRDWDPGRLRDDPQAIRRPPPPKEKQKRQRKPLLPAFVRATPLFRRRRRRSDLAERQALMRAHAEARNKQTLVTSVIERHGPRFFVYRYRHRKGLAVGAVLAAALLLVAQNFIWEIRVEGNETIPDGMILSTVERYGLTVGAVKASLNTGDIAHLTAIQHPDITWLAVNILGCRAVIEVEERIYPPDILDTDAFCNVVASEGGTVVRMNAFGGQKAVQVGDSVAKGDLLVSGVFVDKYGGSHFVHAWGEVIAEVERTLTVEVPMTYTVWEPAGKEAVTRALRLFDRWTVPISFGVSSGAYAAAEQSAPLSILGVPLPVDIVTTVHTPVRARTAERTEQQAAEHAQQMLEKQIDLQLGKDAVIVRQERNGYVRGGVYVLEARIVYEHDIAQQQPLEVAAPGEQPAEDQEEP